MKATVTYDEDEVCAIVLAHHQARFSAPSGMTWMAKMDYTNAVECELIQNKEAHHESHGSGN